MGWGSEILQRVTCHHSLPNSILIVLQLEKFSGRVSSNRLSLLGKCSRICRKSRLTRIRMGELFLPPATQFWPKSGIGFFPQQVVAFRIRDAPNSWSFSCCCCCSELALHVSAGELGCWRGFHGDPTRDHGIPARVSAANAYIGRQTFAARSLLLLLLLPLHKNSNFASGQSQSNNESKYFGSRLVNTQGK